MEKVMHKNRHITYRLKKVWNCRMLYLMLAPVIAYYIIFKYIPMYGVILALKTTIYLKGRLPVHGAGLKCFRKYLQAIISGDQ